MHGRRGSGSASGDEPKAAARLAWIAASGGLACMAAAGDVLSANWTFSASAGATESYNHYIGANQPNDGFVTSLNGLFGIHGEGRA